MKLIATTMKYYRGRTDEADRRAMKRIEEALSAVTDRKDPGTAA